MDSGRDPINQGPRYTRRALLAGGGLIAAGAVAGVTAGVRRGGNSPTSSNEDNAFGSATPPPTPSPVPTPTPTPEPVRGGVARLTAPTGFNFDTFDGARTGEPSVLEVLGRTHSRLVRWGDGPKLAVAPDLARTWEHPDALTWVFRLDPAARWHDRAPLHGRTVTASDVAQHFERSLQLAAGPLPGAQHAASHRSIRRVTAMDETTVAFSLNAPDAFFLNSLAAQFALVQAPEAVAAFEKSWHDRRPESVVGTGPFLFEGRRGDGALAFSGHTRGHRPPLLDGLLVSDASPGPTDFLGHGIDRVLVRDRRDALTLRNDALPLGARQTSELEPWPIISTLFAGGAPWNNILLRHALSCALNRGELARRLFAGRAEPLSPLGGGALPGFSTDALPGYRANAAIDASEAREHWAAGGGRALGPVTVDFPSIFDPLYAASAVVPAMLNETLATDQFRPAIETYTTISARVLDSYYGNGRAALWFGWGPSISDPDPSRYLMEMYHTGSVSAQTTASGSRVTDRALDRLAATEDLATRQEMSATIARGLIEHPEGGVFHWLQQRSEVFSWPYLATPTRVAGTFDDNAETSLDTKHASFGSRRS